MPPPYVTPKKIIHGRKEVVASKDKPIPYFNPIINKYGASFCPSCVDSWNDDDAITPIKITFEVESNLRRIMALVFWIITD